VPGGDQRAAAVLRLAHQLTGDAAKAEALAAHALSRLPARSRRSETALDRAATAHVVRHRGVSRRRAAVVLAFGLGWGADTIAEVARRPAGGVRRDIRAALVDRPEAEWRADLASDGWLVQLPPQFGGCVMAERTRRRRRQHAGLLGVAAVTTGLLAAGVAIERVVTAPAPLPPIAREGDLLPWPPRGELVRDAALRRAAVTTWRSQADGPRGRVYVLYAGRLDGRPTVVLQGRPASGPVVAVLARATAGATALGSPQVSTLPTPDLPAIAVATVGDVGVPVTRLLVAPGVVEVAERTVHGEVPQQRPDYVRRAVRGGLTEPWVSADPGGPLTSIRLTSADGASYLGFLDGSEQEPVAARPVIAPPPPKWTGLPARFSPAALHDDAVWFAQLCRDPSPRVQLIWVGRAPGFPTPLRVERVGCAGSSTARFLTGAFGEAITLAGNRDEGQSREVYAAVVTPPTLGHAFVVIVGSRRVAAVSVGGERQSARVAVVRLERAGTLRVRTSDGTLIPLR
jgi:hypothetical protein